VSQIKGQRRVVVTGLGLVSPVGNTVGDAWENLLAGRSGIATITKFDHSGLSVHFGGEVKGFNIEDYISAKEARHMDTFIHYGIAAGTQAFKDSGLEVTEANSERIGVLVGSGIGGLPMIEETHTVHHAWRSPYLPIFCARLHHQHDFRPPEH
jgi:3-oxoacyl-[acyl-carrier-protein] synthase II